MASSTEKIEVADRLMGDQTDMAFESGGTEIDDAVKKRRKAIKQCLFCRKRKLKCDKQKPMCSTCSSRELSECIYIRKSSSDVSKTGLLKTSPNCDLLNRIKELEEDLRRYKQPTAKKGKNPLCDLHHLTKKSDRIIYNGVTSFRLLLKESNLKFSKYYNIWWDRVKEERQRWKATSGFSTLKEITSIELPQKCLYSDSVLNAMCKTLPPYEEIEIALNEFFNGKLFDNFQILDRKTVMKDFKGCFIKSSRDSITGQHYVTQLVAPNKKNYYCIGIITEILCLTRYNDPVPQALDMFNKYLTSFVTAKVSFIQRVQYMMLRYLYKNVKGLGGGDNSHLVLLAHTAYATAVHIGFHKDIRKLCEGDDALSGAIVYLENLWHWILFADLETSFAMGVPLFASNDVVNQDMLADPNVGSYPLLKKTIIILREALSSIHQRDRVPLLKPIIENLKLFVKDEFKPVSFYLNHDNLKTIKFTELDFLLFCLAVATNFSNIRRQFLKEFNPEVINTPIQYGLVSVSVCITAMETFYRMDQSLMHYELPQEYKSVTPNLSLSVFLVHKHMPRFICELYALIGALGTVSDFDHLKFQYPQSSVFDFPLDTLDVMDDHYVLAEECSRVLSSLFDRFEYKENKEFVRRLKTSCYSFVIMVALEKVNREMLRSAFKTSNNFWGNSLSSNSISSAPNTRPVPTVNLLSVDVAPQVNTSDDVLKSMADEFWNNYENVLDDWIQNDADEIFSTWFRSDDGS